MHLLSDVMKGKYVALKRTAEDRKEWQKLLKAASHTPASQQVTWTNELICPLDSPKVLNELKSNFLEGASLGSSRLSFGGDVEPATREALKLVHIMGVCTALKKTAT